MQFDSHPHYDRQRENDELKIWIAALQDIRNRFGFAEAVAASIIIDPQSCNERLSKCLKLMNSAFSAIDSLHRAVLAKKTLGFYKADLGIEVQRQISRLRERRQVPAHVRFTLDLEAEVTVILNETDFEVAFSDLLYRVLSCLPQNDTAETLEVRLRVHKVDSSGIVALAHSERDRVSAGLSSKSSKGHDLRLEFPLK